MLLIKFLQQNFGISRRAAIEEVEKGRVIVNGRRATHPAMQLSCGFEVIWREKERVFEEGVPLTEHSYIIFNKPAKLITSCSDDKGRKTVIDYLKQKGVWQPVFPIGRLDYDTRGLLLLTTDGDFAQKFSHPKFKIQKVYRVKIEKFGLTDDELDKLRNGIIKVDRKRVVVDDLQVLSKCGTYLQISIHAGPNRVIRRIFEAVGRNVVDLERVAVGPFELGGLRLGDFKYLKQNQIPTPLRSCPAAL